MTAENLDRQIEVLGDLISVSRSKSFGAARAEYVFVKPRDIGGADSSDHGQVLRRLCDKGFAERKDIGGGNHKAVFGYKPTTAGIEFYDNASKQGEPMIGRNSRRPLEKENAKWPAVLTEVPHDRWPHGLDDEKRLRVWRSRLYLVQEYKENDGIIRLSVNKTTMLPNGRWDDGLSWDELQDIKRQAGYRDFLAVEIYPRDLDTVSVANMRHLWIVPQGLNFGWKGK